MRITIGWKALSVTVVALVVGAAALWQGMESYTARSEFCGGSCHVMTEQFEAWQASAHHGANSADGTQAECIDCHFEPGGKKTLRAKFVGLRHLAAYLADPDAHLPVRAQIPDGACLSCHDRAELRDQPIRYLDKVTFKHGPHFDKKIEGQEVFCDTCHVKQTQEKHFEVPKETCFTCHFTQGSEPSPGAGARVQAVALSTAPPLNQGRGTCDTCHEVPTKSLQGQLSGDEPDREPITHQTLIEQGVACESCHLGVVEGTGAVQTAGCFSNCHNRSDELLAKAGDGQLMHERHTATQRADCADCHAPIAHGAPADYLEPARAACAQCHEGAHEYQRILLRGAAVADGVPATPHLMEDVTTNCMGCHVEDRMARGHKVRSGSAEGCVACHGPKHRNVVKEWKDLLEGEVAALRDLDEEAAALLAEMEEAGTDAEILDEARTLIAEGRRFTEIVAVGNGVHNKKYAMMIVDEAFGSFDDAIFLLESE